MPVDVSAFPAATPATQATPAPCVEKILKSFNTWRFKREQPSETALCRNVIQGAIRAGAPIPFVLYWGKGPRDSFAAPDHQCLAFLHAMAKAIGATYAAGARITLIYTDTHARLNGHSPRAIESYGAGLRSAATELDFDVCRLSDLCAAIASASIPRNEPSPALLDLLIASASKWYGGELPAPVAARRYYDQNMIERRAVETSFPDAIFATFNNSQHRGLFPESMPIFYMYSLRKGIAVKPWFLDADGNPARLAADKHRGPGVVAAE